MKIVIEVYGGSVTRLYLENPPSKTIQAFVVDLDGVQVGESTQAIPITPEPLEDASDIIREALPA